MRVFQALPPSLRGSLLIVTGGAFAGILGPLARVLYDQGMTPFAFIAWRAFIAGATLWLLVAWRRRRNPRTNGLALRGLPRREQLALVAFIVSHVVLNTALFVAFDRVPIAVALLTFYTYPVLLAIYGRVSGSEALGPIKLAALAVALVGLGLVVTVGFDPSTGLNLDALGLAMGAVASVTAAAWVGFGRACRSVPAEQAMGLALGVTVCVIGGLALLTGPLDVALFPLGHPAAVPTLLVSGLLSGAGSALLFTMGMRLVSRVRAGILGLIEPIVGTVAAALVLGQVLAPIQLVGGALVLAAAILIQRDQEAPPVVAAFELPEDAEGTVPAAAV